MAGDAHKLFLVCRLTKDPELRALPSGMQVCSLRVAWSSRHKDGSGNWTDRPNYIDVTVWGAQGENVARFLSKGRQCAIVGRLEWREWTDSKSGQKRQAHQIVAEDVQFLGGGEQQGGGGQSYGGGQSSAPASDIDSSTSDFAPAQTTAPVDDDIPFAFEVIPPFEELKGTCRA